MRPPARIWSSSFSSPDSPAELQMWQWGSFWTWALLAPGCLLQSGYREQMPGGTVVGPRLSCSLLLSTVFILRGLPGARKGPRLARSAGASVGQLWFLPPLHHADHSLRPCPEQPGLHHSTDQSLSGQSLGKKNPTAEPPLSQGPTGQVVVVTYIQAARSRQVNCTQTCSCSSLHPPSTQCLKCRL